MYIIILLVNSSLSFYLITPQGKFSNHKTQLCKERTQQCQKTTVQKLHTTFKPLIFNQIMIKKLVQNYKPPKNKLSQKFETVIYPVPFDPTFSYQNYLKVRKICRYESIPLIF